MLTLKDVSAGYGECDVVKNISLKIKNGESLAVIGPNGCGKTTLLKAIAGLLPYKGIIEIESKFLREMKQREISLKVAMLSQVSDIYFSYSVFETVMMGRYPHIKKSFLGLPSDKDREYVTRCLSAVNLLHDKDKEITKLSGGQLQRVFLARTLAQQPDIILLDEPTNHLDLKYQIELIEYLKEWTKQSGNCVIGVLHDINLAMRLSGDILVMAEGSTAAYGKAGTAVTGSLLERVYGIDVAGYMKESFVYWQKLG